MTGKSWPPLALGAALSPPDLDLRPAESRDELEAAYRLVYQSYVRRSYIDPHPGGVRVTLFNAVPDAVTFIAALRGEVIATVSLLPDTPAGLPMDEIYHSELDKLRRAGRRLSEVTMLADRRLEIRRTLPMLLQLMKLVFDYATRVLEAHDLCVTINPRHDAFYKRYLLFTDIGGRKMYPSVRNNPAVARRLNLLTVRDRTRGRVALQTTFFENRYDREFFNRRYRMTAEDIQYFHGLCGMVSRAPAGLIEWFKSLYPNLPWDEWRSHPASP